MGFYRCNRKLASERIQVNIKMIAVLQKEGSWDPVLAYQIGGESQYCTDIGGSVLTKGQQVIPK
jgi:hypothetical protein